MLSNTTVRTGSALVSDQVSTSIDQTLDAVQNADSESPVIVDFDETLFLRNSTEEYLRSVYPRALGAGFVLTAKMLKPWKLLPQRLSADDVAKDWFLVVAATLLFPWTALVWRRRAKRLAAQYCNGPLAQAIDSSAGSLVVATLGFGWVVRPLLQHLPVSKVRAGQYDLVACRFWQGVGDRAKGKLAMVCEAMGPTAVSRAVVVTDAEKDMPTLMASAVPCLLQWPEALFQPSFSDTYIPLLHSEKGRQTSRANLVEHVVLAHWLLLVLASSLTSTHPVLHGVSLLLLVLSYWCIYEIGYQAKDNHAPWPWVWAMGLAMPACFLLASAQPDAQLSSVWQVVMNASVVWLAFLAGVRLTFAIYNRFNLEARMWLYPFLQIQKMFGFAVLISINQVGALLLLALIVSQWIEYCIYRCGGDRHQFPTSVSRLMIFTLLFAGAAVSTQTPESMISWQTLAIFAFCFVSSFKQLRQVLAKLDLVVNSRRNHAASQRSVLSSTQTSD